MKYLLILSTLFLSFSCSYKNQTLDLKISPQGEFTKATPDSHIMVQVFDDRKSRKNTKVFGTKNYYKKEISLSSKNPLPCIIKTSVNKNLKERGYTFNNNRRYLELHILDLNYNSKKGIFIGSSNGEVKIKAIVKNYNKTTIFEKTFDLMLNRKHAIISHLTTDKKTIENLLTEAVEDILQDDSIQKQITK